MKTFTVEVRYSFTGTFQVNANSKNKAIEMVDKHCGCGDPKIHTILGDDIIPDWEFPIHPDKKVVSIS